MKFINSKFLLIQTKFLLIHY